MVVGAAAASERQSVIPHMPQRILQRRILGLTLFAVGILPFIAAVTWVASAFLMPNVFRGIFDLFVPPCVDPPDNWAVAITHVVQLFLLSGTIGCVLAFVGLWLHRRAG